MEGIREREEAYRQGLNRAEVFDCNVWWAPLSRGNLRQFTDFREMLSACEAEGIRGGIVMCRRPPWTIMREMNGFGDC